MLITTPINRIKSEDFDVNFISKYDLYVHLQSNHLNICVFDTEDHRCILFEDYDFSNNSTSKTLLACLEDVWENNHLLCAGFWHKVVVVTTGQDFVFIPYEHYNEDAAPDYLKLNCQYDEAQQNIHSTKHYELDATCCFPVNKSLEDWFGERYNNTALQFVHSNSSFLHTLISEHKNGVSLLINEDMVSIAVLENKKLKFINSFPYTDANDILYFVLFVIDELGMTAEDSQVTIWGNVLDYAPIKGVLGQYIREVSIGERPFLKFSVGFDDTLPVNYGYDLFGTYYLLR